MSKMIQPRTPSLDLDAEIPRHWFGGNAMATHLVNGINLLFPAGERFFVRSVRRYLDQIEGDPVLREQVKGFFGQEGRHAHAHERFFEVMEGQGFAVRRFLDVYERIAYGRLEPMFGPEVRLSVTVALEHYTAILAEEALREGLLDHAHPSLQKLLFWHAAEEIEHRSVAFDVLRKVNPSYTLRVFGLALATGILTSFWAAAVIMLARQDRASKRGRSMREVRDMRPYMGIGRRVFLRGIRQYLRRDFHPSQNDTSPLAEAYLASAGMA